MTPAPDVDLARVVRHAPVETTDAPRAAAVLVPVIERPDGYYLLFTERAAHLGEHPGQMSFPGGGREPEDPDLEATALREAREEIGLDPAEATVLGQLDDIRTVSGYAVRPFVATVPDRTYRPDEREVAAVVLLPVAGLADPANFAVERRDHPRYSEVTVHYFTVDGHTVWGATGRVLVQFLRVVAGWHPPAAPPPGSPPPDQLPDRERAEAADGDAGGDRDATRDRHDGTDGDT